MRLLIGTLFALAVAAFVGLGLTYYVAQRGAAFGGLSIDSWTPGRKPGRLDADPYARASIARSGAAADCAGRRRVVHRARSDDDGKVLDGRCDVVLSGITPAARFWTLTLYNPDGGLVANSTSRYGFTSEEIVAPAPTAPSRSSWRRAPIPAIGCRPAASTATS